MSLEPEETAALVTFWRKYMAARKAWESLQVEAQREGKAAPHTLWLAYVEDKERAFSELAKVIPEIRYTDFWRDVVCLRPQACVDGILRYRKEKSADREQRDNEKKILSATKGKNDYRNTQ